jgi:hypothetical protein
VLRELFEHSLYNIYVVAVDSETGKESRVSSEITVVTSPGTSATVAAVSDHHLLDELGLEQPTLTFEPSNANMSYSQQQKVIVRCRANGVNASQLNVDIIYGTNQMV